MKFKDFLYEMTVRDAYRISKRIEIPNDISNMTRDEAKKKCPDALKLYDDLIDTISSSRYKKSVEFIDDIVKDPKLKFLLSLGFGGNFSSYKLSINNEVLSVRSLKPTQNDLSIDETLDFVLGCGKHFNPTDISDCFKYGVIVKRPIVVFNHKYIIDGHHRWGQIYIVNPNATTEVINITGNISLMTLLKSIHCTIGSNIGNLNLKPIKGDNLYTSTRNELEKRIHDRMTDEALNVLSKYFYNPNDALLNHCELLKANTKTMYQVKRAVMPQTSKDKNLFADLSDGIDF